MVKNGQKRRSKKPWFYRRSSVHLSFIVVIYRPYTQMMFPLRATYANNIYYYCWYCNAARTFYLCSTVLQIVPLYIKNLKRVFERTLILYQIVNKNGSPKIPLDRNGILFILFYFFSKWNADIQDEKRSLISGVQTLRLYLFVSIMYFIITQTLTGVRRDRKQRLRVAGSDFISDPGIG